MITTLSRLQRETVPKTPDQLPLEQQIDLILHAGEWVNRGVFTPVDSNEQFLLLGSSAFLRQRAADLLQCPDGPQILTMAERVSSGVQSLQLSPTGFMKDSLNEVIAIYAIAELLSEEPQPRLVDFLKEDARQLRSYEDRVAQALLSNQCIERLIRDCNLVTSVEQVVALPHERDREIFDLLVSAIRDVASGMMIAAPSKPGVSHQAKSIMDITHALQRLVGTDPSYSISTSRYGALDLEYPETPAC